MIPCMTHPLHGIPALDFMSPSCCGKVRNSSAYSLRNCAPDRCGSSTCCKPHIYIYIYILVTSGILIANFVILHSILPTLSELGGSMRLIKFAENNVPSRSFLASVWALIWRPSLAVPSQVFKSIGLKFEGKT